MSKVLESLKKLNEYLDNISDEDLKVLKHRIKNMTEKEKEAKYYAKLEQMLMEKSIDENDG